MKHFIAITCLLAFNCMTVTVAAVAKPTCGGSTSSKDIQLINPVNPPRECLYTINDYSSLVCQLRIDFAMTLAQPSLPAAGNNLKYAECQNDYFLVNGIKLCGVETSQHVYVPFNRTAGVKSVQLKVVLAARSGMTNFPTPTWDMKVTQLECPAGAAIRDINTAIAPEGRAVSNYDGFLVAPPGCLQYFPQSTGAFTSFNYNNGKGVYPGNMNYAICFRRTTSTTGLQLQSGFFRLGAEYQNAGTLQMDNYCYSQLSSGGVSDDYLMIPQAIVTGKNVRATYFCGESLQGSTIKSTSPGPLVLLFNSDGAYSGSETGFVLTYKLL